jgi:hypothetical protein
MRDEKVLLILDGSEALIDKGAIMQFRSLLRMILTHTAQLKLVVTTNRQNIGRMTLTTESVLEIHPLSDVEMSKMILQKCPILRRGFANQENFIGVVSKHECLKYDAANLASLLALI